MLQTKMLIVLASLQSPVLVIPYYVAHGQVGACGTRPVVPVLVPTLLQQKRVHVLLKTVVLETMDVSETQPNQVSATTVLPSKVEIIL